MTHIRFVLNGVHHELTRDQVETRLTEVRPEPIQRHAVRIGDTWFPVLQALEAALGVSRRSFISHTARRHLAALGFEVRGDIEPRATSASDSTDEEWHREENVQAAVVTALAVEGWHIVSVANTAARERGVDVIASRDDETVGIEVKGYPSRHYADPRRAGEIKPTAPTVQAAQWFAGAVVAAMKLRTREPTWRSVMALPDFTRYRNLHTQTLSSLDAAQIEVWWVRSDGSLVQD